MSQRNGAQSHAIFDEFVAVDVPNMATMAPPQETWCQDWILIIPFGIGVGATRDNRMCSFPADG